MTQLHILGPFVSLALYISLGAIFYCIKGPQSKEATKEIEEYITKCVLLSGNRKSGIAYGMIQLS